MAPALSFSNVGMTFPDGTEAVRDVSFDVAPQEFVTVVGPSGCGKSTLLRMAAGLLRHTAGEVSVNRERLGFVFQDATLMEWRTVQGKRRAAGGAARDEGAGAPTARRRRDQAGGAVWL